MNEAFDKIIERLKLLDKYHDGIINLYQAIENVKEVAEEYGTDTNVGNKDCNNCANNTDLDEVDNGCYMCCKGLENNYQPKGE